MAVPDCTGAGPAPFGWGLRAETRMSRSSSGPRGAERSGVNREAERSAEDPGPSTTISGDLLITGAAPSWPASAPEGSACRSRGSEGRRRGRGEGRNGGSLSAQREGLGARETMAPPTPRTLSTTQMRGLPGCARRLGLRSVWDGDQALYLVGSAHFVGFVANSGNRIQTGR